MEALPPDPAPHTNRFPQPPGFHPEALPPDQEDLARGAFQAFLDGLAVRLSGYFGIAAETPFGGARQGRFADLISVDAGACTALLESNPVPGYACVVLSRDLASAALELLLGAPAGIAGESRESLTELDQQVLQGLIDLITDELRKVWLPLSGASFRNILSDRTAARAREELHEQSVFEMRAEVTLQARTGSLQVIVPSLLIRLAAEKAAESASAPVASPSPIMDALQTASLRVDAVLRGDGIRIRDLLRLKPGAVLQLPRPEGTPVECMVNGVIRMSGGLVADGKSVGFQVQELHGGGNSETVSARRA